MKRYKLLKDLPTFKAGQLAYISKTGNLIAGTPENQKTTEMGLIIMIYHETTLKKFPNILTEWFEEIQEPRDSIHWKPKNGEGGWLVFYNHKDRELHTAADPIADSGEPVRYATKEDALKSIRENKQDWLIYFGIKEYKWLEIELAA